MRARQITETREQIEQINRRSCRTDDKESMYCIVKQMEKRWMKQMARRAEQQMARRE
jgi:hypothetical protein